ncbi:phosphatase PAP2 family protein [Paenibacillus aurantiacus]|uniref:Phosphatase PAP2 family protein n=1 Tax=Paenibacillus aurantiacus TaxID=1936118 RepID=A0ABV5KUY8_9BACL
MNFYKNVLLRSVIASGLCMCGFIVIAILIGEHRITSFDTQITKGMGSVESASLTKVMIFFTMIGSGWPVAIITLGIVALLTYLGHRKELIVFVSIIVGSALFNSVLKLLFHRARPIVHRLIEANGFSFPSGHSMSAFTLYGLTTFFLWKHVQGPVSRALMIITGTALVLLIGASRIYLGVHYPSDVIGGYLASGAWLLITIAVYQHFLEERWESEQRSKRLAHG